MRPWLFSLLLLALLPSVRGQTAPATPEKPKESAKKPISTAHPLDPLTADEIKKTSQILRKEKKTTLRAVYAWIVLAEPTKEVVGAFRPGDPITRKAKATFTDGKQFQTYEAVVNLTASTVESCIQVAKQSPAQEQDNRLTSRIVRADDRWVAAIKKLGLNPLDVEIGALPNRGYLDEKKNGDRYVLAMAFVDDAAEPAEVSSLMTLVNLTKRKVEWVRTDPSRKVIATDPEDEATNPDHAEATRPAPKPLKVTQPDGASFTMEGNLVKWQNWRFRVGSDPRVGLVLHTIGYDEGAKTRSILYRASLSELFVPYGDPTYLAINWFDAGEFGMETAFSSSFNPGNDAPEYAKFLPVVINGSNGKPRTLPAAIAIYERDGGILWRHGGESRRARDLVVAAIHQAGNYDYCFQWIFHQDGSIDQETLLTGFMETRSVERVADPDGLGHAIGKGAVGTLVAKHLEASNHQHFFSWRLDFDVDGPVKNQLVEMNTTSMPTAPQPNGMLMTETVLRTEAAAQRNIDMASHRCWKIVNSSVRNSLNQSSAYMIIPGESAVPYSAPTSFLRRVSRFTEHQLWATPYDPTQLYSAGDYVYDGAPDDGIAHWTLKNRPIEYEDVVLYLTSGVTHIPRVEDWPIMPTHRAGFRIVPAGFFSKNPAMGVPASGTRGKADQ